MSRTILEVLGMVFICIGLFFNLVGCLGLIRLPDVYNRLHAATKCVTLGTCGILFGTFAHFGISDIGLKALLCIVFLAIADPVAAHAVSRASHRSGIPLCKSSVVDRYAEDHKDNKEKSASLAS